MHKKVYLRANEEKFHVVSKLAKQLNAQLDSIKEPDGIHLVTLSGENLEPFFKFNAQEDVTHAYQPS